MKKFYIEVVKPSHYDDDGYVIQWVRAFVPSSTLGALIALAEDAKNRGVLGKDVELVVQGYDESHTVIPTRKIIKRINQAGGQGLVLLVGVQTNQFPRASDLAREFRDAGIQVAIGGFHVSGCVSMLDELPPELVEVQEMGVSLFAGEAEGTLDGLLEDAFRGEMKPIYNHLADLPDLQGQATSFLPSHISRRSFNLTAFDAGRGCPFNCNFCTIINVQGRKPRHRSADDVEQLVRAYSEQGVCRFFITDDNFARNKNWERIFDRLIQLREEEGIVLKLFLQVDTMCHKIPNFIEKAARAGCKRVFIGMESINPANLSEINKPQNQVSEYRTMLLRWREQGVLTHAGYILGFPADTPESIERDIRVIQEELPIDIIEFFILTPLPGSVYHRTLHEQGVWMQPDLNNYDLEHVITEHPRMSAQQWLDIYNRAWQLYYSPQHVETLMRRAKVCGCGLSKMLAAILAYHGSHCFEKLHPLQSGVLRRKRRSTRRPSLPKENPLLFYPRRLWETLSTYLRIGGYYLQLERLKHRINRDPSAEEYTDTALTPDEPVVSIVVRSDEPAAAAARAA